MIKEIAMKIEAEEIVMMDSPEAASVQTVTGWVDRYGNFWGKNEDMARRAGATHMRCPKCGGIHETRSFCKPCYKASEIERWRAMPREAWNGEDALYSDVRDEWFFSREALRDYCEDHKLDPDGLRLIICVPSFFQVTDIDDIFTEDLPEDCEIPDEIQEAFDALVKTIQGCRTPLSWSPGKTVPTPESLSLSGRGES